MKKQNLPNRSFLTNFAMQTILLIILLVSNILPQVIINARVEINPIKQQFDSGTTTEGDGWWIDTCYFETYDSSEVDLTFTPAAIEPGETTIMTLDYNEELHNLLERNIILEPNIGTLVWNDTSEYKYYAPTSTPGDTALVVKINYEQFWWYCAVGALRQDSIQTNNTLEDLICGCPIGQFWTKVNRRYGIDSIMIAWDSLDVKVVPDTIYPGDTAQVVIKKRLPNGILIDFDSTQTYEVGMLDGCILGNIKTSSDSGYYVYNVTQPIYFIADSSADTTGAVLLRVGLVEQARKPEDKNSLQKDIVESDCFIGGQFKSYEDVTVVKDNPLEIIYPTQLVNEEITNNPQMPEVICKARLKKFYPGVIKYEWKYIVQKTYNRRESDDGLPICDRISRCEFHGVSYSSTALQITEWNVLFIKDSGYFYFKAVQNFQDPNNQKPYYGCGGAVNYWYDETSNEIFTGGDVSITLTAKYYQTGEVIARLENVHINKILGKNPDDPETYHTYANSNKIKAIMWKEARYRQFTHQETDPNQLWPYDGDGWPLYGEPNGYGIMQLDNTPAATERQLWNWKANIDGGKQKLTKSYEEVYKYHGTTEDDKCNWTNAFHNYRWGNKTIIYKWDRIRGWKSINDDPNAYGTKVYKKYIELGGGN